MSIPKEPRQLMINVMYLVLTALLALNVSAEIFNAFDMVDKGLKKANSTLDLSNNALPELIKDGAKKKQELQKYADRVDPARKISSDATTYIQSIIDKLIDESGDRNGKSDAGDYLTLEGGSQELKGKRDYDATTRFMVTGENGKQGEGKKLKEEILKIRDSYMSLVDEADRKDFSLPLSIDEDAWKKSVNKKASWEDFTFGHMPVGATMPIFTKYINDVKASEAQVLNYLAKKVGTTTDVVLDKFRVVAAPKQSYIIKGDTYEADVFLSAAAGAGTNTGISISVNGAAVRTDKDGVAKYTAQGSSLGKKEYKAAVSVKNPVTGEVKTYNETFSYEVGERSVAVSASKMNVFYIGVDNPVEVSAAGVNSNDIKVSMGGSGGGSINKGGDGTYNVRVSTPTAQGQYATINVSAPGLTAKKDFRVKRIPDPRPMLGKEPGGRMGDGQFKAYPGVLPVLENFDFDAKCDITEFLLIRQARRQDAEFAPNNGGKYSGQARSLVDKAAPGDTYILNDIKCRCPGDGASRNIGQLVVTIK